MNLSGQRHTFGLFPRFLVIIIVSDQSTHIREVKVLYFRCFSGVIVVASVRSVVSANLAIPETFRETFAFCWSSYA